MNEHAATESDREGVQTKAESLRTYFAVYAALMVLLVLTVAASFVDFAKWRLAHHNLGWLNISFAMIIAVIKSLLVVLFFMHLRHSSRLTWIFAGAAFLWLGILLTLTLNDYLTRRRPLYEDVPDKSGIRQPAQPEANGRAQVSFVPPRRRSRLSSGGHSCAARLGREQRLTIPARHAPAAAARCPPTAPAPAARPPPPAARST